MTSDLRALQQFGDIFSLVLSQEQALMRPAPVLTDTSLETLFIITKQENCMVITTRCTRPPCDVGMLHFYNTKPVAILYYHNWLL